MKLECQSGQLRNAVLLADKITGKNLSLTILSSIVLETTKDKLIIKATNLEVGLEITIPAKIKEEGRVAINGQILGNILQLLVKDKSVNLELKDNILHLSNSYTNNKLNTQPLEDFPTIPKPESKNSFTIKNQDLTNGLNAVVYAASLSDIKPEIASVYLYQDNDRLVFVATDSFRLAEKSIINKQLTKDFPSLIIPIKNVLEIIKIITSTTDDVVVTATKNQLTMTIGDIYFTSRIIDGIFPDYRQIMPKTSTIACSLDRNDLLQTIKLASVFTDKFRTIDLNLNKTNQKIIITSANQGIGENDTTLDAKIDGGEPETKISVNAKYLLDGFISLNTETVVLKYSEFNKPLLLEGVGDDSFRYLIMPLRR